MAKTTTRKVKAKVKVKAKPSSAIKWEFEVILWDSKRTRILMRKKVSVVRKDRFVAKYYVQKKYPLPYSVELI